MGFGVWSVEFGVWSVKSGVWSVKSGVWSLEEKLFLLRIGELENCPLLGYWAAGNGASLQTFGL